MLVAATLTSKVVTELGPKHFGRVEGLPARFFKSLSPRLFTPLIKRMCIDKRWATRLDT